MSRGIALSVPGLILRPDGDSEACGSDGDCDPAGNLPAPTGLAGDVRGDEKTENETCHESADMTGVVETERLR